MYKNRDAIRSSLGVTQWIFKYRWIYGFSAKFWKSHLSRSWWGAFLVLASFRWGLLVALDIISLTFCGDPGCHGWLHLGQRLMYSCVKFHSQMTKCPYFWCVISWLCLAEFSLHLIFIYFYEVVPHSFVMAVVILAFSAVSIVTVGCSGTSDKCYTGVGKRYLLSYHI